MRRTAIRLASVEAITSAYPDRALQCGRSAPGYRTTAERVDDVVADLARLMPAMSG